MKISRKFGLTIVILVSSFALPLLFKHFGVSDAVSMLALSVVAGIGVSYHIVNLKEARLGLDK